MEETSCCVICHKKLPNGVGRFHTNRGSVCVDCHEMAKEPDSIVQPLIASSWKAGHE